MCVAEFDKSIKNYTKFDDWYLWVQMHKGTVSMPVFQSLEAFWPGLQVRKQICPQTLVRCVTRQRESTSLTSFKSLLFIYCMHLRVEFCGSL